MTGVAPCARVLGIATVGSLRGGAATEPSCHWGDDKTLYANLNYRSTVQPGDAVALLDNAIGPVEVAALDCPGNQWCTSGSATIPTLSDAARSPCGNVTHPTRACPTPVAQLSGPALLSSCADATLKLSGEASSGGGARPLTYSYGVASANNALAVGALPGATGATAELTAAQLSGGSSFAFTLTVTSFLGVASAPASLAVTRATAAAPTLTIEGPGSRAVRPDRVVVVRAAVELASCYEGAAPVDFAWSLVTAVVTGTATACGALPASIVMDKPFLRLDAGALAAGCTYTLQVGATMREQRSAAASATVELVVESLPLRAVIAGGDRAVSAALPLVLDGRASVDPNGGALAYAWSVTPPTLALPSASRSAAQLELDGDALEPGVYTFELTVSSGSAASATARVVVTALAVTVPSIAFAALAKEKYAATWSLPSQRIALTTSLDAAAAALVEQGAFTFAWAAYTLVDGAPTASPLLAPANLAAATTTGAAQPNLVFRSGALEPGTTYVFELTVAPASGFSFVGTGYGPIVGAASASATIRVNAPPFGGGLEVDPASGDAMTTKFALSAPGWTDDAEDLPLLYSFGYTDGNGASQGLGASTTMSSITGLILPEGNLVITVVVADQYGATAAMPPTFDVVVSAPSVVAFDGLVASASDSASSGQPEAAQRLITALAVHARRAQRRRLQSSSAASVGWSSETARQMLDVSAAATASSEDTPETRLLSVGTIAAVLSAAPDTLDALTRIQGLEQLRALVVASRSAGVGAGMLANVMTALDAVLLADASAINATDQLTIGTAGAGSLFNLGLALLAGAAAGEAPTEVTGGEITVSASRSTQEGLPGSTVAPPTGTAALAVLPPDLLAGQSGSFADGIDTVLYALPSTANLYADPTAQLGAAATTGFGTQLVSLQLASATDGSALAISDLPTPIYLALPRMAAGGGSCSSNAGCSGGRRGACVAGACVCASPYAGANCGEVSVCRYWDASTRLWKTDGCVALEPNVVGSNYSAALAATGVADGSSVVLCACDHLTTFAGLVEPDTVVYAPPPPSPPGEQQRPAPAQPASKTRASSSGGGGGGSGRPSRVLAGPTTASPPVALIVGAAVGGCAFLCGVAVAVVLCRRARRRIKPAQVEPLAGASEAPDAAAARAAEPVRVAQIDVTPVYPAESIVGPA